MIKADLHVHTSEVSSCAFVTGAQMVRAYDQHGYKLMIITDHYYDGFFARPPGTWREKIDCYLSGYRCAYAEGERLGLTVLLGVEIRFVPYGLEDFLLYGPTPEDLYQLERLYDMEPGAFATLARERGWSLIQAHPTRKGLREADPSWIEGVEVYNGNPRHQCIMEQAQAFAMRSGLYQLSASDAHEPQDIGQGGMWLDEGTATIAQIQRQLRMGGHKMIIKGI